MHVLFVLFMYCLFYVCIVCYFVLCTYCLFYLCILCFIYELFMYLLFVSTSVLTHVRIDFGKQEGEVKTPEAKISTLCNELLENIQKAEHKEDLDEVEKMLLDLAVKGISIIRTIP